ncbi:MAG: gluconate 2-dehydrogenase subunit 3 family protein [Gemmatimonadales bacterium]
MERRDLLRALGAAAAFTLMPRDAQAAWSIVVAAPHAPPRALIDDRAVLVSSLADAIIPRTDSPSATDVGVTAFIDVIVAENYNDDERAVFLAGLDAIGARVRLSGAASFAEMAPEARNALLDSLDRPVDQQAPEARAWSRLKGLVIHGYFTSERVQKEVLKTEIMPGRFDGNARMKAASGGANG